ncbi:MAG TPA: ATP-binding protein [bacterium]|nr:ATP-binding protein [bacterium]
MPRGRVGRTPKRRRMTPSSGEAVRPSEPWDAGMGIAGLREQPRPAAPVQVDAAAGPDDDLHDLRTAFLHATGADRCVIKLAPNWRRVVGHWLNLPAGERDEFFKADPSTAAAVSAGRDGTKGEARGNLRLGKMSAAQIIVTTNDRRVMDRVIPGLTALMPRVAARLCFRWLRDEAHAVERRRLIEILHDGPLQAATAAKIRLRASRQFVGDPRAAEALDEAIALTGQVIRAMREVLADRVRPGPDSLGSRMRQAGERWSKMTGVRVHIALSDEAEDPAQFSEEALDAAAHVVGEGIVNAWKHGDATQVSISCHPHDGGMLLTLSDDGGHRPPSAPDPDPNGTRMGLRLLRARIRELGGRFDARPGQEGGTIVEAWLPLSLEPSGTPQ